MAAPEITTSTADPTPSRVAADPDYLVHAARLVAAARESGELKLASGLLDVVAAPHREEKVRVAEDYLATLPPEVAQRYQHMFTKTLLGGG